MMSSCYDIDLTCQLYGCDSDDLEIESQTFYDEYKDEYHLIILLKNNSVKTFKINSDVEFFYDEDEEISDFSSGSGGSEIDDIGVFPPKTKSVLHFINTYPPTQSCPKINCNIVVKQINHLGNAGQYIKWEIKDSSTYPILKLTNTSDTELWGLEYIVLFYNKGSLVAVADDEPDCDRLEPGESTLGNLDKYNLIFDTAEVFVNGNVY